MVKVLLYRSWRGLRPVAIRNTTVWSEGKKCEQESQEAQEAPLTVNVKHVSRSARCSTGKREDVTGWCIKRIEMKGYMLSNENYSNCRLDGHLTRSRRCRDSDTLQR